MEENPSAPLLIVWHSRTGASEALARAAFDGAREAGDENAARLLRAEDAGAADLETAGGYLFVCPENLGALSGEMKAMFDRTYYALLGRIEGRPYATIIAAGSAGQGAQAQLDRIVTGWRLRRVTDSLIANLGAQTPQQIMAAKTVDAVVLKQARDIGLTLGTGLNLGVF